MTRKSSVPFAPLRAGKSDPRNQFEIYRPGTGARPFCFCGLQLEESGCLLLGESRKLRGIRGPKVVSSLLSAQERQICPPHQIEKPRAGTQDSGSFCFWGCAIKTNRSTPRPTYQTAERGALGCEDAEHCPEYSSIRNKKKPVTESPAQEGSLYITSCGEGTERPGGQVLRTSDCLAPAWG